MATLKDLEVSPEGTQVPLADVIDQLKFNNDGLIPAIAQDHDSGAVLMLAWMDRHAIQRTLAEGQVVYYSRSRQAYWRKGEFLDSSVSRRTHFSRSCLEEAWKL